MESYEVLTESETLRNSRLTLPLVARGIRKSERQRQWSRLIDPLCLVGCDGRGAD
jgi:hypothetical protein